MSVAAFADPLGWSAVLSSARAPRARVERVTTNDTAEWSEARERALVDRARAGDLDALRALFERFSGPLFGAVILPNVGHRADAEDVLRETLASAAEKIVDFHPREGSGVWAWLRRIATNRVIDRSRRLAARQRATEAFAAEVAALPPRIAPGADVLLIEREERAAHEARLERALSRLRDRHRRAIELRIVEERDRAACAAELGIAVNAFDVLLHRALGALKRAWEIG